MKAFIREQMTKFRREKKRGGLISLSFKCSPHTDNTKNKNRQHSDEKNTFSSDDPLVVCLARG